MARLGATHRTTAPSCTPATRDRAWLHREVHGRPAACRNPGLLDDPGLASASRPRIARGPQKPGRQPGHPGARSSSPAPSGRPGWAPIHPLRRDPRSAPPPGGRSPCGRQDGRGRQRSTAIQEDPVRRQMSASGEMCGHGPLPSPIVARRINLLHMSQAGERRAFFRGPDGGSGVLTSLPGYWSGSPSGYSGNPCSLIRGSPWRYAADRASLSRTIRQSLQCGSSASLSGRCWIGSSRR